MVHEMITTFGPQGKMWKEIREDQPQRGWFPCLTTLRLGEGTRSMWVKCGQMTKTQLGLAQADAQPPLCREGSRAAKSTIIILQMVNLPEILKAWWDVHVKSHMPLQRLARQCQSAGAAGPAQSVVVCLTGLARRRKGAVRPPDTHMMKLANFTDHFPRFARPPIYRSLLITVALVRAFKGEVQDDE